MKKKWISLAMACGMMTAALTGCGGGTAGNTSSGLDGAGSDTTLTLATWNMGTEEENNINRRMLAAFTEKTGIKVEIEENIDTSSYDDSLSALAAASKLPDIIMVTTTPYGLENEWFVDLTEFAENDPDWKNIPPVIEQIVHYKDGIWYVPVAFYMEGYFVNDDLFEQCNVEKLEYGCSMEDFMNAVRSLTNLNQKTVGLLNESNIVDWYAASVNDDLGWFTWDGEKYNLDSPEFQEGINIMNEIRDGKYSVESLRGDELTALDVAGTEWDEIQDNAWYAGKVGIRWAGTWNSTEMMSQRSNFSTRFIGTPGGRTPIVCDFMGVTPGCENKEAAYELLKWMSFSEEGIQKRMELDETGTEDYNFPVSTNTDIINAYCEHNVYPGMKDALLNMDNCIMEINKFQPGYFESRSYARTGRKVGDYDNASMQELIDAVWKDGYNFADYAAEANRIANEQYKIAVEEIEALY